MPEPLLSIEQLTVTFRTEHGPVQVVDIEQLTVGRNEVVGLVGESGCGKSSVALSILGLHPAHAARVGGRVVLEGRNLVGLSERELQKIRGSKVAMIFQDPATAFNPVFTVGEQLMRVIRTHKGGTQRQARARALELLELVGMPDPAGVSCRYPHQLSGGQRQRIMIAVALSCGPDLLIADEPTTALDVTIEAQILDLLKQLQRQFGMGVLLITHDLGVVARTCDRVAVMYAGRVVEEAPVADLFRRPAHPYSRGLLGSLPRRGQELRPIGGTVPDLRHLPPGCRFAPRCPLAVPTCTTHDPKLIDFGSGRSAACPVVHAEEVGVRD
ncbi:MAG: oligopeptide/dipeptide transporter, ATPase subunit [Firmicutes bacterium]|nr:oligopeptide/dipeptide transporter, ATPase subunit [Bacillota bacterium]